MDLWLGQNKQKEKTFYKMTTWAVEHFPTESFACQKFLSVKN